MFLIALGLAGLIFGVGSSETRRFENAAASDISSRLGGQGRQVKVRTKFDPFLVLDGKIKSATITASSFTTEGLPLFTQPSASQKGRLGELKMVLTDFRLGPLPVRRLEARIPDCRFDFGLAQRHGRIRLSRSGEGIGSVEVTEEALGSFILTKFREIKRVTVRLADGKAVVEGYGEFLVFNTNFRVEAGLSSPDGNTLVLTSAKIFLDGKEADEASRRVLLDLMNPVVDLDKDLKLYGAVRVSTISLENGLLKASGKTKIPDEP
jgi:hypothetical protein